MEIIFTIIIFLLVLFSLILVHEWGHFIVAKLTGMRVDEFGIGFPPKIAGFKKGETEYTINWLPIGGFVRIWGENYDEAEEAEKLSATERARAFSARPRWAQALVLIAGVTMNIVFAWLLFVLIFMIGTSTAVNESEASDEAKLTVVRSVPGSPAKETIPLGANIVSVSAGEKVISNLTPATFGTFVTEVAPEPVTIEYIYKEKTEVVTLSPQQGLDKAQPERYLVGLSLAFTEIHSSGPIEAVVKGYMATLTGLKEIRDGLWLLLKGIFDGSPDFSDVGGPILIATMTGEAVSLGITTLMSFAAMISLNLAVINLLPIPALDGGRLIFVLIEAVIRRPIPPVWAGRVNMVGFAMLMLLMVAVTYKDISDLL